MIKCVVIFYDIFDDDFGDSRFLYLPVVNFGIEENVLNAHD